MITLAFIVPDVVRLLIVVLPALNTQRPKLGLFVRLLWSINDWFNDFVFGFLYNGDENV